jgi:hypothetical protein
MTAMHTTGGRIKRILLTLAALLLPVASLLAHPHSGVPTVEHAHTPLGLEVTVADDGVTCQVLLSNGYFNRLIPRERGHLKLARRGEVFVFLNPEQEAAERDVFAAFFAEAAPQVVIDGMAATAVFDKLELLTSIDPMGITDHSLAPPDARVVLRFPASAPPRHVKLDWTLFPVGHTRDLFGQVRPPQLPVKLDAYAETRIVTLTPDQAELVWEAPPPDITQRIAPVQVATTARRLPVPVASILFIAGWALVLAGLRFAGARAGVRRAALAISVVPLLCAYIARGALVVQAPLPGSTAAAPMSAKAAQDAFTALLSNVYRAFDFKSESDIYDVLAQSVDGRELEAIYNEIYQGLVAGEQGGAVSRVKDVDFITVQYEPAQDSSAGGIPAFQVRCRWRVHGVVHHWGHVHERTNEYKALYTVAQRGDLWKITGCEVLGQRRLPTGPPGDPAGPAAGSAPS